LKGVEPRRTLGKKGGGGWGGWGGGGGVFLLIRKKDEKLSRNPTRKGGSIVISRIKPIGPTGKKHSVTTIKRKKKNEMEVPEKQERFSVGCIKE